MTPFPQPSTREERDSALRFQPSGWNNDLLPKFAAAMCALFGLLFLLNVHPVGDGLWFWYATALRNGQKLYGDLHVPMQPLFIFITEWNQRLLGRSWLASKAFAAVQDGLYCLGIYLVSRRVRWPAYQRAILIAAVFGLTIMAFYYRFDDYHITGHCLLVFSVLVSLRLKQADDAAQVLREAAMLGLLTGLSAGNRLNDGGLLGVASAAAVVALAPRRTWAALATFVGTAVASFFALILLTGDSIRQWADDTIFHAVMIKGGTNRVLIGPYHFPRTTWRHLTTDHVYLHYLLFAAVIVAAVGVSVFLRRRAIGPRWLPKGLLAIAGLGALYFIRKANAGVSVLSVADGLILFCYIATLLLLLRVLFFAVTGRFREWNRYEALFLFPFGQIIAGAMTSGESFLEAYPALAIMLLILPFVFPVLERSQVVRSCYATLLVLLAGGTLEAKWSHPYYWHHFNNGAMFTSRTWYRHPDFGPMYVERDHLALITSLCQTMHDQTQGKGELLAMPWPYPNYFCNVPPWHGYVQTWYDTTSAGTIQKLLSDLEQQPPEWIAYQRAPDSIYLHEAIFFNNKKLPHRMVDALVLDRIRSGAWTLPWQRCFSGADWMLIHTRPALPNEVSDTPIPSTDHVNLCSRTEHGFMR